MFLTKKPTNSHHLQEVLQLFTNNSGFLLRYMLLFHFRYQSVIRVKLTILVYFLVLGEKIDGTRIIIE